MQDDQQSERRVQVLPQIITLVEEAIGDIQFGTVTIAVQDSCIVQIEKNEKIRINASNLTQHLKHKQDKSSKSNKQMAARILSGIQDLQYGQLVIMIKDGSIAQVERLDKQRMANWQGIYGEGI